jgi:two-component system chemotaxis sensor kinase CheA
VDWLGARQEIVVRPLSELVPRVPAVSGSTQLGDGRTVLILDPSALARRFGAPRNEVAR